MFQVQASEKGSPHGSSEMFKKRWAESAIWILQSCGKGKTKSFTSVARWFVWSFLRCGGIYRITLLARNSTGIHRFPQAGTALDVQKRVLNLVSRGWIAHQFAPLPGGKNTGQFSTSLVTRVCSCRARRPAVLYAVA
jgi:hypothetical protein